MSKLSKSIQKKINEKVSKNIRCRELRSSIVLEGMVDSWDEVVKAGKISANEEYKGVVNNIEVRNLKTKEIKKPILKDKHLEKKKVDVLIIGGGIIGSSIARELSKWNVSILLLDKENDLAKHASSRNDGMVHPGLAPKPGTKRAYYNIRGNKLYSNVTKELNVSFRRIGSLLLINKKMTRLAYPLIKHRANQNGLEEIKYLNKNELLKREPKISKDIAGAIYIPSTGILSPYKMTIAYAENAVSNGAEVSLNTIVTDIKKENGNIISVSTNRGEIYPKVVINAAGVFSDKIAEMVEDRFFTIHPRKGEIVLFDKKKGNLLDSALARLNLSINSSTSKGGGIVKTIEGNLLLGPNEIEIPYREDFTTASDSLNKMLSKFLPMIPTLNKSDIITYLSGIRASTYKEDFIVEKSEYVGNLVHAAGIQSPGLASAPAIAEEIEKITIEMLRKVKEVKPDDKYNPIRKEIKELNRMNFSERNEIIRINRDYGTIICRCEEVSKGEIIDCINGDIKATSIDAVKRRTRAGMGRCQGGFCMPLVTKIINEETDIDMLEITKKGNSSNVLVEETKGNKDYEKEQVENESI